MRKPAFFKRRSGFFCSSDPDQTSRENADSVPTFETMFTYYRLRSSNLDPKLHFYDPSGPEGQNKMLIRPDPDPRFNTGASVAPSRKLYADLKRDF